eukprot:TRINITY_DN84522_c0_g1_i1.p1 TRINITY_DN84522_c0_g1~~TRINITY_DN84522_c0_g1_i1.p1  ORF type:complete len:1037 (-),score=194.66 TRINITY_DN84522_c0_g1_i1:355-3009(-)
MSPLEALVESIPPKNTVEEMDGVDALLKSMGPRSPKDKSAERREEEDAPPQEETPDESAERREEEDVPPQEEQPDVSEDRREEPEEVFAPVIEDAPAPVSHAAPPPQMSAPPPVNEDEAATKIQAIFRGHKGREEADAERQERKKTRAVVDRQTEAVCSAPPAVYTAPKPPMKDASTQDNGMSENDAATKIQSRYRGYQTRRTKKRKGEGILRVTVVKAVHVRDPHTAGACATHVEVKANRQHGTTSAQKGTVNPYWNETFEFKVRVMPEFGSRISRQALFVEVIDRESIGKATVPLEGLKKNIPQDVVVTLPKQGQVLVTVLPIDFGLEEHDPLRTLLRNELDDRERVAHMEELERLQMVELQEADQRQILQKNLFTALRTTVLQSEQAMAHTTLMSAQTQMAVKGLNELYIALSDLFITQEWAERQAIYDLFQRSWPARKEPPVQQPMEPIKAVQPNRQDEQTLYEALTIVLRYRRLIEIEEAQERLLLEEVLLRGHVYISEWYMFKYLVMLEETEFTRMHVQRIERAWIRYLFRKVPVRERTAAQIEYEKNLQQHRQSGVPPPRHVMDPPQFPHHLPASLRTPTAATYRPLRQIQEASPFPVVRQSKTPQYQQVAQTGPGWLDDHHPMQYIPYGSVQPDPSRGPAYVFAPAPFTPSQGAAPGGYVTYVAYPGQGAPQEPQVHHHHTVPRGGAPPPPAPVAYQPQQAPLDGVWGVSPAQPHDSVLVLQGPPQPPPPQSYSALHQPAPPPQQQVPQQPVSAYPPAPHQHQQQPPQQPNPAAYSNIPQDSKPWLGIDVTMRDDALGNRSNVAVVRGVQASSPADNAGLQVGDILEDWSGIKVNSIQVLEEILKATKPGMMMKLTVVRKGIKLQMPLIAGAQAST